MAVLEARKVGKVYDSRGVQTRALEAIDLAISEGEFSVLAGPSGSGKTTLLNLLGGLDAPTSGEILLDGERLADLSPSQLAGLRLRKLGFVFQAYNLIPVLTLPKNFHWHQAQTTSQVENHAAVHPKPSGAIHKGLVHGYEIVVTGGFDPRFHFFLSDLGFTHRHAGRIDKTCQ